MVGVVRCGLGEQFPSGDCDLLGEYPSGAM